MEAVFFKKALVYKGFLVWGRHSTLAFSRHVRVSRTSDAFASQMTIDRGISKGSESVGIRQSDRKDRHARVLRSVRKNYDRLFQNVCVHVPGDTCVDNWVQNVT